MQAYHIPPDSVHAIELKTEEELRDEVEDLNKKMSRYEDKQIAKAKKDGNTLWQKLFYFLKMIAGINDAWEDLNAEIG